MNKADDPALAFAVGQERERNNKLLAQHPVVSQEEWLKQRLALMEKEKQYVRQGDALSAEVSSLPWVKVEKDYLFTSPDGDLTLKDLFRGHSQLYARVEPRRRIVAILRDPRHVVRRRFACPD